MSWESMCNTIRSRFKTLVADAVPLQTQYDNMKFNPPDNTNWCRLTIVQGSTDQVSIGAPSSNRERTLGVMIAQLFAPVEAGDGTILGIADDVRRAFKRVTASGVTFKTPYLAKRGREGDSWQINVMCPFYADEIG